MRYWRRLAPLALLSALASASALGDLVPLGEVELSGQIAERRDLSAVQVAGDLLVVASDETTHLVALEKLNDERYALVREIPLLPASRTEVDTEALAFDGDTLYALGSHSWVRKGVEANKSRAKNLRRLATLKFEASRDRLFRIDLDGESGEPGLKVESVSLRTLLANHPALHLFAHTPGKENGIDFEGLAAADGRLLLGLRGPVLRGNWTPVLRFAFDDVKSCSEEFALHPGECEVLYLDLGGFGVRSLHRVRGGFLLIAGPVGDHQASHRLYFWDGRDCIPDEGSRSCRLEPLGNVPAPAAAKAEGLAVLAETEEGWEVLVVYDGADEGARFLVARP